MVELYSRIIEKGEKATSFFSVFYIAQEVARELGLETDDVVQQFRADMVRSKYQKKDPV